jgi:hypothetical protein
MQAGLAVVVRRVLQDVARNLRAGHNTATYKYMLSLRAAAAAALSQRLTEESTYHCMDACAGIAVVVRRVLAHVARQVRNLCVCVGGGGHDTRRGQSQSSSCSCSVTELDTYECMNACAGLLHITAYIHV